MIPPLSLPAPPPEFLGQTQAVLMQKAKELETAFLSEMLSFSGLGTVSTEFGGGIGEDQFASFLRQEQARLMVERGGIGLARTIFESLVSQSGGARMTSLDTLLEDVALQVRRADFSALARLTPQLETALAGLGGTVDAAVMGRLQRKAEENALLLDASRRGLRAARRRLEETRRVGAGLQTYDGKGRRSEIISDGPTAGRF